MNLAYDSLRFSDAIVRFALPPQYSRLLLGIILGFVLGTVLYQLQRRDLELINKGQLVSAVCGNGIKEGTEQCDDGNTINGGVGDPCKNDCTGYCAENEATFCEDTTNTASTERPGACCSPQDGCDHNGGKCNIGVCPEPAVAHALGDVFCYTGTETCTSGTAVSHPYVDETSMAPPCTSPNGCNGEERQCCLMEGESTCSRDSDCCTGSCVSGTCRSRTSSSSLSGSACSVPDSLPRVTYMCSSGHLRPCLPEECMTTNTCPSPLVPDFGSTFAGGTCPTYLEGNPQDIACACPSSSSSANFCCNTETKACYQSSSSSSSICGTFASSCSNNSDCCSGLCGLNGTCGCQNDGGSCVNNNQCCNNNCNGGPFCGTTSS